MCILVYIYIYMYRERKRNRQREIDTCYILHITYPIIYILCSEVGCSCQKIEPCLCQGEIAVPLCLHRWMPWDLLTEDRAVAGVTSMNLSDNVQKWSKMAIAIGHMMNRCMDWHTLCSDRSKSPTQAVEISNNDVKHVGSSPNCAFWNH